MVSITNGESISLHVWDQNTTHELEYDMRK